jgi:hypothetical protein
VKSTRESLGAPERAVAWEDSLAEAGVGIERMLAAVRRRYALRMEVLGAHAPRLLRAQVELARIHAEELARICARAAQDRSRDAAETSRLRGELAEALESCRLDRVRASPALRELLGRLSSADRERPADALELAEAAVALRESSRHEACLARILSARGRERDALELAVRSWHRHPAPNARAELSRLLSELSERAGRTEAKRSPRTA